MFNVEVVLLRNGKSVILVSSGTPNRVVSALKRYAEFYENPVLGGRLDITAETIDEWWSTVGGSSSYDESWAGFNVPGPVFMRLAENAVHPGTDHERELLGQLAGLEIGYVVGVERGKMTTEDYFDTVEHELSHAAWYLDQVYREAGMRIVDSMRATDPSTYDGMRAVLVGMGYDEHVVHDEVMAYLATGLTKDFQGVTIGERYVTEARAVFAEMIGSSSWLRA